MSNTTILNSKAMQTLLARSEAQSPSASKATGASFQQLLEGALGEKAATATSPAGLAKSVLASDSQPEHASAQLAKVLGTAAAAHKPDAAKQLAARPTKDTALGGGAANDDAPAAGTPTVAHAGDGKSASATAAAAALDATQLKQVNAPALPTQTAPPPAARESPQLAQARAQPAAGPKPASPAGPQPLLATGAPGIATPRGFAAVLAGTHVSNALPTSLVEQASFDPSLQMSVTPQGAHLSMDTGSTGPLIAQLQITNGVADIRLSGDAASVLARHGAELSLGLTAAGLQPGRIEITAPSAAADLGSAMSGGGSAGDGAAAGGSRGETLARDDSQAGSQSSRHSATPAATTTTLSGRASRVHVKA